MTDRERLEVQLEAIDIILTFLKEQMSKYEEEQRQLNFKLNEARRLEKELHNDPHPN